MNCPHCGAPIPPELILRERQSELAKRKRKPSDGTKYTRPGAIGLVRNPKGRKPKADGQPSETAHRPNVQDQSAR